MKQRLDIHKVDPQGYQPLIELEKHILKSGLSRKLYHLIKTRASQINGCHYCINMHTRDAMKDGETAQRLFLLDAWRETELYTDKERAILALTEEMTLIANHHVSDEVWNEAAKYCDEKELAAVVWAVIAINSWNRLAISTVSPLD